MSAGTAGRDTGRLRHLVREGGRPPGDGSESADPGAGAGLLGAEEVAGRVEATLEAALERVPADEVGDPREYRRALHLLLGQAERTVRKLEREPDAPLTRGEASALEAVIRTDGSRPTLLVRGDAVDADHPLAGSWSETFAATKEAVRGPVRAVGRVEPAGGTSRNFFGTGWVVDDDAGLVLTNLHVLEAMWRRLASRMQRQGRRFRVLDGAFVDFAAEAGSLRTNRFRVVEATPSWVDGPGLARLDAAVLRIEPTEASEPEVPTAIPVVADVDAPLGNVDSFCAVGFPGRPRFSGGVHEGVNWGWVNTTLFGNRYGVKRLAPGLTHRPLGSLAGDPRPWIFGHDLTTLGGSSGSPLLGWLDSEVAGFGLHFAGASVDTNLAHAVAQCVDELRAMGVPVRQRDDPRPEVPDSGVELGAGPPTG